MKINSTLEEINFSKDPLNCTPETTLAEALDLMQTNKIANLIISRDREILGIFTERDFLMKIAGKFESIKDSPINDYMTANPKTVTVDEKIVDVLDLMRKGRFRHVVVADKYNKLAGIVSIKDLFDFLIEQVGQLEATMKDLVKVLI